jgi:Coenzyme PQQ synthesis protein D (PqqD)
MSASRLSDSAVVVAARDLLATEFSREFVILNLTDGVYYGLEEVGARMWALLQSPVTVRAICDALVSEYDVEPARCTQDIQSLLRELVSRGLVDVRESC